ncbi:MAG: hypothetical protein L0323_15235 [Planctomycetes bacterium]|nr:hypothetical protein [Planctomycetota bacterium]
MEHSKHEIHNLFDVTFKRSHKFSKLVKGDERKLDRVMQAVTSTLRQALKDFYMPASISMESMADGGKARSSGGTKGLRRATIDLDSPGGAAPARPTSAALAAEAQPDCTVVSVTYQYCEIEGKEVWCACRKYQCDDGSSHLDCQPA